MLRRFSKLSVGAFVLLMVLVAPAQLHARPMPMRGGSPGMGRPGFHHGRFDPRFHHGMDPRFHHGRFDPRFHHGMDPRFHHGTFDPRFSPRMVRPGFFRPF